MKKRQDEKKHVLKKFTCGAVAAAFCVSAAFPVSVFAADDLEQERTRLEQQIKDAENEIERLGKEKANTEEYLVALAAKMDLLQKKIDSLTAQIKEKEQAIAKLQAQIDEKVAAITELEQQIAEQQKQFDEKKEQYNDRLRILYISGNVSNLEALLTSEDVGTLLTRAQMISSVSKKDQKALDELVKSMESIQKKQSELNGAKKELEDGKVDLLASKSALEDSKGQLEKEEAQMLAERGKNEEAVKTFQSQMDAQRDVKKDSQEDFDFVAQQIKDAEAKIPPETTETPSDNGSSSGNNGGSSGSDPNPPDGSNSNASGGSNSDSQGYRFTHPCPGRKYISVGYPTYSDGDWHGGVDFACWQTSPPIYAADDGVVIIATDLGDRSYGRYIVIRHEPGLYTLYGHCSELYVSAGQRVTKGQNIAKVGSTGNSSGNHLHFEVRLGDGSSNRNTADPAKYVKDSLLY